MTATLAMFPLELVVFPGEHLPLHIFENRYQQLIQDCETQQITFGIPAFVARRISFGTEVKLEQVKQKYPSGASDIVCTGLRVFKVKEFYTNYADKLYSGATVQVLENDLDGTLYQRATYFNLVKEFYEILGTAVPSVDVNTVNSYSFAHKLGLSIAQELELLQMKKESDRYVFLIDHLSATIPVIAQINRTRRLIELNGHFKNFDPLDFTDYKLGDLED